MKKLISIYCVAAAALTACNNEVFIDPLLVSPQTASIEWTGGEAVFTSNQNVSSIDMLAFRWVNGKALSLTGGSMHYLLRDMVTEDKIKNQMCDITLTKDDSGRLIIASGYNLFPDTVYFNIDFQGSENVSVGARIMPSPGFGHGPINYFMTSYTTTEHTDTVIVAKLINVKDEPNSIKLGSKGDTIAYRAMKFEGLDPLVSDNIFGRKEFEVEGIEYDPTTMWWPEMSGKMVPYTSKARKLDGGGLVYDEDLILELDVNQAAVVKRIINSQWYGINYDLPAISPIEGLADRIVKGHCWIIIPTSYEIEVEFIKVTH